MKLSLREPKALRDRPCEASFFLAKLPALVAENALAEAPLMILRSVMDVPELVLVVVLRVPDEDVVEFVLVVKVRPSIDRPTSYADFRCRSFGSDCKLPAMEDLGRLKELVFGGTAGPTSSFGRGPSVYILLSRFSIL